MRKTFNPQPNLREPWLELEHARELETISSLLDAHPKLNELVLQDLKSVTPSAGSDVGRGGMSAEQVLRALLVKQLNQFSYRELAFHLADSRSYRTFCQLGIIEPTPSKSTLAANIKAVKFETLEQINRELVSVAEDAGIEKGRKVRVDCTVVESNIHPPTDSELLYPGLRRECHREVVRTEGRRRYPAARDLAILADAGGSNGYRCRGWKHGLQTRICNRHDIAITIAHYPSGTSKWNPVEHRLFSEISKNWAGRPLDSYETILKYIRTTTTSSGLRVRAHLIRRRYPKGVKITDERMQALSVTKDQTLPKWNYTIRPS